MQFLIYLSQQFFIYGTEGRLIHAHIYIYISHRIFVIRQEESKSTAGMYSSISLFSYNLGHFTHSAKVPLT